MARRTNREAFIYAKKYVKNVACWIAALYIATAGFSSNQTFAEQVVDRGEIQETAETIPTSKVIVSGFVRSGEGEAIENAIIVSAAGGQAPSRADGSFTLTVDAPREAKSLMLTAAASTNGVNLTGTREVAIPTGTQKEPAINVGPIELHSDGQCQPQWLPMTAPLSFESGTGASRLSRSDRRTTSGNRKPPHINKCLRSPSPTFCFAMMSDMKVCNAQPAHMLMCSYMMSFAGSFPWSGFVGSR